MITFTVVNGSKVTTKMIGDCDFDDFFSISVAESCSWQSATHDLPHSGACTNMYHCSIFSLYFVFTNLHFSLIKF